MRNHVALTIDFGRGGNSDAYRLDGWSLPETDFCWTIGRRSALRLPRPLAPHGMVLELKCAPFADPARLAAQRLTLCVDGQETALMRMRIGGNFAWFLPSSDATGRDLSIVLDHPDAARPRDLGLSADEREIALMVFGARLLVLDEPPAMPAIRASAIRLDTGLAPDAALIAAAAVIVGMTPNDFVTAFEAVCGNCEFGFFQRYCGAEPLSLLRFAAGRAALVMPGIDRGFAAIGEPSDLDPRISPSGLEWMIQEKKYGLVYHTFTSPNDVPRDAMIVREAVRLKFLARKFMEDATEGRKIFVCKDERDMPVEEVLALVLALNRHGPCTVLWAGPAADLGQNGRVEVVAPRLLRGYLDRLSPVADPSDFSPGGWLSLCVNALLLHRQPEVGPR